MKSFRCFTCVFDPLIAGMFYNTKKGLTLLTYQFNDLKIMMHAKVILIFAGGNDDDSLPLINDISLAAVCSLPAQNTFIHRLHNFFS